MRKRLLSLAKYTPDVEQLQPYRAKLMEQQERTAHALVQRINKIVTSSQDTAILQDIGELLCEEFEADCCFLVTENNNDESQELLAGNWCINPLLDVKKYQDILLIHKLLMKSAITQCTHEPLTMEDVARISNKRPNNQYLPEGIQSLLAIPTRINGKNNGIISLIKFENYDWQDSEKELLKSIESSCALAMAQVTQTYTLNHQKDYLHKASQHQNLIKQLTTLNFSNLELNKMLQLVIESTAQSLEVDRGLLILLKYTDPMFRNRHKQQIPTAKANVIGVWNKDQTAEQQVLDVIDKSFFLSECGLCQRVFLESGKLIMMDTSTKQENNCQPNPLFATQNFQSTLLVPLENQGNVLGFIVLQQETNRTWQPSELNLVEMVCTQLSNAIIQSQTLKQVQNLVDERTEQLKRSLEVQAKLYERTKQYVEQLQELNELKDEFVSNLSDRLRYPLTNMRMSIRNLRLPGITPERQARYLDILESECTKEINLINDLLTLQKLESHQEEPQLETINLNNKFNHLVAEVEPILSEQGLSITVDIPKETLKLQTEIESFDRILQELFNNVSKYSERDTRVHLEAAHRVEKEVDQVIIKVTNVGNGISPEEAAYIFDKFRRGKGRWTPGTGLGLALVKSLVQHLHGAIAVESTPIENSSLSQICFTLTLPQFSTTTNTNPQQ